MNKNRKGKLETGFETPKGEKHWLVIMTVIKRSHVWEEWMGACHIVGACGVMMKVTCWMPLSTTWADPSTIHNPTEIHRVSLGKGVMGEGIGSSLRSLALIKSKPKTNRHTASLNYSHRCRMGGILLVILAECVIMCHPYFLFLNLKVFC